MIFEDAGSQSAIEKNQDETKSSSAFFAGFEKEGLGKKYSRSCQRVVGKRSSFLMMTGSFSVNQLFVGLLCPKGPMLRMAKTKKDIWRDKY